jgi:hypothetical protein
LPALGSRPRKRRRKGNKRKGREEKGEKKRKKENRKMNYLFFRNYDLQFILTILLLNNKNKI